MPPPAQQSDQSTAAPASALSGAAASWSGAVSKFDWRAVIVGNWIGAAIVAAGTAAVTGAFALVLALVSKPPDFGLFNTLALATTTAAQSWGADLHLSVTSSDGFTVPADGSFDLSLFPLTITLVAAVVAVLLFRRVTAAYTSGLAVLSDAARTAVLFGVCLFVPALIFRFDNDELGSGWGYLLSSSFTGVGVDLGANSGGALFKGFASMFVLLALATLARRGLWSGLMAGVHRWLAGPIRAAAVLLLLSPLAGVIGYLALALSGDDPASGEELGQGGTRAVVAGAIAFASNAGLWLIGVGVLAPFQSAVAATGEVSEQTSDRLWGAITEDTPGLWVAPLVAVASIVVLALVVTRTNRALAADDGTAVPGSTGLVGGSPRSWRERVVSPPSLLAGLIAWIVSLVVVVPFVVGLTNIGGSGSFGGQTELEESLRLSVMVGISATQKTLLVMLVAAVVAFVFAMRTGIVDPAAVRANVVRAASAVQSSPGTSRSGPESAGSPAPAQQSPAARPEAQHDPTQQTGPHGPSGTQHGDPDEFWSDRPQG